MGRLEEQQNARLQKLTALKNAGIDPYPAASKRTHRLTEIRRDFDTLEKAGTNVTIAGRIMQVRAHGGSCFLTLADELATLQVYLKKDTLNDAIYQQWVETIDIGDFFEFSGSLFKTKRGEPTLLVHEARILTKSLRAIPEQHYGIKDTETRLRKRYLDLLVNANTRALFEKKNLFWQTIRNFFTERGFLEVETPVIENLPGGADAKPFKTHYDALDEERFLRISLELPLKRLLVGGFERVMEIGRIFRNEGMSPEHLQDYTQMECYWAYADYHDLMRLIQELFTLLATTLHKTTRVTYGGVTIDFAGTWLRYDYYDVFQKYVGMDLDGITIEQLKARAKEAGIPFEKNTGKGRLIDLLYKKFVRPKLQKPGFLIDPPVDVEPLAKRCPDHPDRVERMQVIAWGTELGKGFSELNDPMDQRKRFEEQMALRKLGDEEAQRLDEDFLEALEYGMPPAAGFGMSERFFAFLMDLPIRETVLFPPMRTSERDEPVETTHITKPA